MSCAPLSGMFRCDACTFSLRDGRELVINITDPGDVEQAAISLGVHVTGQPVAARSDR